MLPLPRPYRGHRVVVFVTLQAQRAHVPIEWHKDRFKNLPSFDEAGQRERARVITQRFLDAGAQMVVVNIYDLVKVRW